MAPRPEHGVEVDGNATPGGTEMRGRTHEAAKIATSGGFTLLELLVVMVIIGLLAGFVAPRYFSQVGKSRVKAASAQIDALDAGTIPHRRRPSAHDRRGAGSAERRAPRHD
jgi:prepilin-type N-terminal cleavage/methylation domain-containing protein